MASDKYSFGRDVLGPIFAEFAFRLSTYLSQLERREETAVLFCARGGLRLQLLYERFLAAAGLPSPVHQAPLMISRVVAVRPALLAGATSAFEQIGYEFADHKLIEAASAVSGIRGLADQAPESWQVPYSNDGLRSLLKSPEGQIVTSEIQQQADRFRRHLLAQSDGRRRLVLCDTGLFGSTLQLLEDGMNDFTWSAVLIARCNYKRLPAPHFARTVGLSLEADSYCPWQPRTAMLRYWLLIESIFEPDLPSVATFTEPGGVPRSNLEVDGWETRIAPQPDSFFAGILAYVDGLAAIPAAKILNDAPAAWRALHHAVTWPRAAEGELLDAGPRSHDFGRDRPAAVVRSWHGPIAALRGKSIWREGEIARARSPLRKPLLLTIETFYSLRWCRRNLRRLIH